MKYNRKKLYYTLVDLKVAVNSTEGIVIWKRQEEIQRPKNAIQICNSIYYNIIGQVRLNGRHIRKDTIKGRHNQKGSLRPLLFIIAIDKIIQNARKITNEVPTIVGYKNSNVIRRDRLLSTNDYSIGWGVKWKKAENNRYFGRRDRKDGYGGKQ